MLFRGFTTALLLLGILDCKGPVRQNPPSAPGDITYENGTEKARTISLPDGTSVVMSAHTVIKLSQQFNRSGRQLELDGEALFTVKSNAAQPFVLLTRNLHIEDQTSTESPAGVLDTRFRVDAFRTNAGEQVDLLQGTLKVTKSYHSDTDNEPETITSGQMVMINRDIDLMEKEKLDSTELKTLKGRW